MDCPIMGVVQVEVCFVQTRSAKIQPQPAKMEIVMIGLIPSGEYGFGSDRPQPHFIGEKNDIENTLLKIFACR